MNSTTCSCGAAETRQHPAGYTIHAGVWRRAWMWLCDPCSNASDIERERSRRS